MAENRVAAAHQAAAGRAVRAVRARQKGGNGIAKEPMNPSSNVRK